MLRSFSDLLRRQTRDGDILCRYGGDEFVVVLALCGTEERPSAKLLERADAALYRAKQERKGSCCLWEA